MRVVIKHIIGLIICLITLRHKIGYVNPHPVHNGYQHFHIWYDWGCERCGKIYRRDAARSRKKYQEKTSKLAVVGESTVNITPQG